jgi:CBS domain-containing protein
LDTLFVFYGVLSFYRKNIYFLFGFVVIEIKSDTSLAEAVRILAEHKILSAPVVDVDAPEDASWIDRYIGVVEFAGIIVWILHQVR